MSILDEILRNHQQALVDEQKKLQQLLSSYMENENVNVHWRNICDLYDTKIKNIQPEIMVYGIYNAGKSSILNELIGEDKARVADIPTTDSVIYYDWNGYRIADTPGIMAPIQHQNVTQEHLKKADVVLFVMSTTGSNEKRENYVRMKEISDAGKKIIIVLNDKNGDLNSGDQARESALQLIKIQVANHMKQVGIEDVDSKYCIVVVNAERSRKGRIGNKENMIIKSNFNELKKVMLSELKRTTSFDILRNAITEIEKSLLAIIQCLETSNQSTSSKELNRILETLQEQKINIRKEIHLYIQQKSQSMGQRLPILIWEHRNDQEKLNEVMGKEIDILIQKVQGKTELLLKDMAGMMQQEIADVSERMASMDMHGVHEITVNQEGMNALEE